MKKFMPIDLTKRDNYSSPLCQYFLLTGFTKFSSTVKTGLVDSNIFSFAELMKEFKLKKSNELYKQLRDLKPGEVLSFEHTYMDYVDSSQTIYYYVIGTNRKSK